MRTFDRIALTLGLFAVVMSMVGCATSDPVAPQQPGPPLPAAAAQPADPAPLTVYAAPPTPLPAAPAAPAAKVVTASGALGIGQPRPSARPRASVQEAPTQIPASFPVTVKSGDGSEVTFNEPPRRIVAFDSAIVEILFAIGEGDRVIATHQYVDYPPEVADIPRVGDAFNMDIEAIVAMEPDLVFVFFDRFVEDLERVGLSVLYIPTITDDFTQIADHVRMWGSIVGNPQAAALVASDFEARVKAVEKVMEPIGAGPVVFQDAGGFWTPGQGTMMQEVFDLLKLENAAADIEGYAQISPEVIVERDPALVLTGDPEGFAGNPAFENIFAVRNGAIYTLSSNALSVQGPRFVDGVEELAAIVYPGLFR